MKKHLFLPATLLLALLSSCSNAASNHQLSDYIREMSKDSDSFNILQLTDIHWNMTTDVRKATEYLNTTIKVAKDKAGGKLDLIAVTGDSLLVGTKELADRLYSLIDSWDIPFFVTYGNHDLQGQWSTSWMNENVSAPKRHNSYFVNVNDSMEGESNYVINWKKDGKTVWQIYSIDTGHYISKNPIKYGYNYIHDDQIKWYEEQTDLAKGEESDYLPSIVFGHIPLVEVDTARTNALEAAKNAEANDNPVGEVTDGYVGGYTHEKVGKSFIPSRFHEAMKTHGGKGMFYGHDHSNDLVTKYDGVVLGYGVKANTELYSTTIMHDGETMTLTGGALYTLKTDKTFDIEHIYIDYNDSSKVFGWKKESL